MDVVLRGTRLDRYYLRTLTAIEPCSYALRALDTLAANERSPSFISSMREWHLPRMNRPDPMPPWEWRKR